MSQQDFFLRQIEGAGQMLAHLLGFGDSAGEETQVEMPFSAASHSLGMDLALLLNLGRLNEAENLLFRELERDTGEPLLPVAEQFYDWLDKLPNAVLLQGNFTREEIVQGREDARRICRKNRQFTTEER